MNKINIIPMAGDGLRFVKNNILTPKPFIKINGEPMFYHASKCMPQYDKFIYICQKKHLKNINISNFLKLKNINSYELISIDQITKGQAETVLLSENFIQKDDRIFVHSCDSYIFFDKQKYQNFINSNDIVIFTTKPNNYHLENINSFGWVSSKNQKILNITCKKPASNNPSNDNVIVGTFAFNNKLSFVNSIKNIIKKKIKINDEYYLDIAVSYANELNYKVVELVVDKYISWGTPEELQSFLNNN